MTSATLTTKTDGEGLRKRPLISLVSGAIAVGVLIAGCGGSTTTSSSSAGSGSSPSQVRKQFVGYAACMRAHGVPGYPDPRVSASGNGVSVGISPGRANPNSPAFRSADRACRQRLPSGFVQGAGGSSPRQEAQDLAFADCMRARGVSSFPDADRHGVFTLPASVNEQAPAFVRAERACPQPSSLSIDQALPTGS
jgi:hypothetical protein